MYWNTLERSGLSIFDLDVSLGRAINTFNDQIFQQVTTTVNRILNSTLGVFLV